jgi:pimeloyl-ACP methyl ester carboxylesterase
MRRVEVSGAELAVEDRGSGSVLLLVHGFPLDHAMWLHQVDELSATHRVLAPDLRGFGASDVTEGKVTMRQFARDLGEMLDALGISEPVALAGLSMGGYIAFQFWQEFSPRLAALILCDTRANPDSPQAAADRLAAADRVVREGAAALAEGMLPKLLSPHTRQTNPQLAETLRRTMLANPRQGIAAAARGMAERPDMTPRLGEIRCPVLVVVGADDGISPPAEMRAMAAAIPHSHVVEIPQAGHMSPLEQPAAVNRAIVEFLR